MLEKISSIAKGTFEYLAAADYSALILMFMLVLMGVLVWNLNKKDNAYFTIEDLLIDSNKKASTSKIAILIALIISSWAFIHLTLNNTLTEWYFGIYMSAWVLNKSLSRWLEVKDATNKALAEEKK